jgi:hypothetical protein
MKKGLTFPSVVTLILFSLSPVLADYTLLLKNGRRITVQSYREEGSTIKFRGLGGEIGISKDQIQSIEKARETEPSGSAVSGSGGATPTSETQQSPVEERAAAPQPPERQLSPEEERAKEEVEYQQKVSAITEQLRTVSDRYSQATRGSTGPQPSLLSDPEAIKVLNDDAMARSLDAQNNPVDPGVVRLLTPSPFSSLPPTNTDLNAPTPVGVPFYSPPPAYTERQKELSDLRNQAIQLEQDRKKLIDEMKQKNISTGSMFLE